MAKAGLNLHKATDSAFIFQLMILGWVEYVIYMYSIPPSLKSLIDKTCELSFTLSGL